MRKIILASGQLLEIKNLREAGASWLQIEKATSVPRRIAKREYEDLIQTKVVGIGFQVALRWRGKQLLISCPSVAVRDFLARVLEDNEEILLEVKEGSGAVAKGQRLREAKK